MRNTPKHLSASHVTPYSHNVAAWSPELSLSKSPVSFELVGGSWLFAAMRADLKLLLLLPRYPMMERLLFLLVHFQVLRYLLACLVRPKVRCARTEWEVGAPMAAIEIALVKCERVEMDLLRQLIDPS